MLLFWALLFGFITSNIATNYGIPHLFLLPEYLGETGILSHFILGFAIGGFIMAFNIASYIINGRRFPFIATLSRPFAKYTLNNSLLPLAFLIVYTVEIHHYQTIQEFIPNTQVFYNIAGFYSGISLFIIISLTYFFSTNTSIHKILKNQKIATRPTRLAPAKNIFSKHEQWYTYIGRNREWKIYTYLASPIKVALARDIHHYDERMLRRVFSQNHVNASLFELLVVISILFFGFYRETPLFALPAGASVVLFFTLFIMLGSAVYSWLKAWSVLAFIIVLFGINELSKSNNFTYLNYAYGLNYQTDPAEYNNKKLKELSTDSVAFKLDKQHHLNILNQWLIKNQAAGIEKPKLVLLNCSGGGLRSTLWSFLVLQYLEQECEKSFFQQIHMISGSSGGMIGAAYFRDLYFEKNTNQEIDLSQANYRDKISQDLLNPIALNMALHDWFFRIRDFEYAGQLYPKDRGYAFERQLSFNSERLMEKQLIDYYEPEANSDIPLLILSPVVNNDGRRLIISSQPSSFLTKINLLDNLNTVSLVESVEFSKLMKNHQADSLSFLSALRMSATFPYVLPNVSLPTEPRIEIVDAGVRDNYGFYNTARYITTFKDWINQNTSGVVVVQIRDRYKTVDIERDPDPTFVESLVNPISRVYANYLQMQDYNQDEVLHQTSSLLKNKLSIVNFQLKRTKTNNISLSLHLTEREKQKILKSIEEPENKAATEILKLLLSQ